MYRLYLISFTLVNLSNRTVNKTKDDVSTTMKPYIKDFKYKKEGRKFDQRPIENMKRDFLMTDKHINPEAQPAPKTKEELENPDKFYAQRTKDTNSAYSQLLNKIKFFKDREQSKDNMDSNQLLKRMYFQAHAQGIEGIIDTNKSYTKKVKNDKEVVSNVLSENKMGTGKADKATLFGLGLLKQQIGKNAYVENPATSGTNVNEAVKRALGGAAPAIDVNRKPSSNEIGTLYLPKDPSKTTIVKEKKGFDRNSVREKWLKNNYNPSASGEL